MAVINKAANTSFGIFGLAAKGSSCTLSSTIVFIISIIGTDGGNNEDKCKESKNSCVFHDEFFVLEEKHLLFNF
jgi:hypothetical protein